MPRTRRRPITLVLAFVALAGLTSPLVAQDAGPALPSIAADRWVRVDACPERPELPDVTEGRFIPDPVGIAVASASRGVERIPLSRVRVLRAEVRRERDLRALGVVIGMVAGPYALAKWANRDTRRSEGLAMAAIVVVPVTAIVSGAAGFWVGSQVSAPREWEVVPLPSSHGTACVGR